MHLVGGRFAHASPPPSSRDAGRRKSPPPPQDNPANADEVDAVRRSEQKMTWQKNGNFSLLGALSDGLTSAFRRPRTLTTPPPPAQLQPSEPTHRGAKIIPFPSSTAIAAGALAP